MKRFYLTGVSGVGKSSVSEALNQLGIYSIDIDQIDGLCRWVNKNTHQESKWHSGIGDEWLEAHEWICDKSKLAELMERNEDVVVVGAASNQSQYLDLFDKIFLLQCSQETFLKRITDRTNNDFGKHPSEQVRILNWYKDFGKNMLNQGAIYVDTDKPLPEVVDQIVCELKKSE